MIHCVLEGKGYLKDSFLQITPYLQDFFPQPFITLFLVMNLGHFISLYFMDLRNFYIREVFRYPPISITI